MEILRFAVRGALGDRDGHMPRLDFTTLSSTLELRQTGHVMVWCSVMSQLMSSRLTPPCAAEHGQRVKGQAGGQMELVCVTLRTILEAPQKLSARS